MIKPTPNPPEKSAEADTTSPYETRDSKKLHEAVERVLDHHLCPPGNPTPKRKNGPMYAITPDIGNEELLANACETLASAKAIANDFAGMLPPAQRTMLLGIAQLIMISEVAVNQVLDNAELAADLV